MITPDSCPKYEKCSANICPLDPNWKLRAHMNSEPVCFYLREYVKQGGIARLRGVHTEGNVQTDSRSPPRNKVTVWNYKT